MSETYKDPEWLAKYPNRRLIRKVTLGGEYFGYNIDGFDPDKEMPGRLVWNIK